MRTIELIVNGTTHRAEVPDRLLLSDFLRDRLGVSGVHVGCEHGACGSCTIALDGRTVRSCLMFASQADGVDIETVESLSGDDDDLHPLQASFIRQHALQCGFCTPAMILAGRELLQENPKPTEEEVREAISGILCRCTGYQGIVDSILAVAEDTEG